MITGFQATMTVDDGGTGVRRRCQTAFTGLVTLTLPGIEASTFDATELNQLDGGNPDPFERELPTGLQKIGKIKGSLKYTKANYTRCQALDGVRSHVFILTNTRRPHQSRNTGEARRNVHGVFLQDR